LTNLVEMDEKVKLLTQIEENVAPVILINKFNVKADEVDQFQSAWTADAQIMVTRILASNQKTQNFFIFHYFCCFTNKNIFR
jgi:hypothetical protein